jgi:hypothetical protein
MESERYGISEQTVLEWRHSDSVEDHSHAIERSRRQFRKRIHPLPQEVVEVEISNDEAVHLRSSLDWPGAQRINDQSALSKAGPVLMNIFILERICSNLFRN